MKIGKLLAVLGFCFLFVFSGNAQELTNFEQSILEEINLARQNPQEYAKILENRKQYFSGKTFSPPGEMGLETFEGVKAVDEAIKFLKKQKPLGALTFSSLLQKTAAWQLKDVLENPNVGHTGKDGSSPADRIRRAGIQTGRYAENISYLVNTPRSIVQMLVVDDGVKSRGHRKAIFTGSFTLIGISYGVDSKGNSYSVTLLTDPLRSKN